MLRHVTFDNLMLSHTTFDIPLSSHKTYEVETGHSNVEPYDIRLETHDIRYSNAEPHECRICVAQRSKIEFRVSILRSNVACHDIRMSNAVWLNIRMSNARPTSRSFTGRVLINK